MQDPEIQQILSDPVMRQVSSVWVACAFFTDSLPLTFETWTKSDLLLI